MKNRLIPFCILVIFVGAQIQSAPVMAQPAGVFEERAFSQSTAQRGDLLPLVVMAQRHDLLPSLRELPLKKVHLDQINPRAPLALPKASQSRQQRAGSSPSEAGMALAVETASAASMPAPLASFEGVENLFGGWPPDTQGDIGPNHYVQWINLYFAIWEIDRETLSATRVYGPAAGNTLFSGFGGPCEATNDGDPITLYDPLANRWLMSQFALPNFPNGPFYECVAVSQSSDPTGGWYRYEFPMPVSKMNDYPKFGVWPDAYYMTVNQFESGSLKWAGAGVAAYERDAMLVGAPARMVFFDLFTVDDAFGGMLPADFDGLTLPPDGAPGYFLEWDDGEWIGPQDALRLWEFHVDWTDTSLSTFGVSGSPNLVLPTSDADASLCDYNACIPQPGTTVLLDTLSDRLMHRLQYRNFGSHQALVTNHTVDVDGNEHAGIHWFELRKIGADWSLFQEGVFAPDAEHRWMGSAALDHMGNMGLGYSASSSSTFPAVRYAGRLAGDPLGTLPQGEQSLAVGGGSQIGSDRWGDYSMLAVDPVDDCTFWYTQEYLKSSGSNTWTTRIGAFRFPNCSLGPGGMVTGTVIDRDAGLGIGRARVQATLGDGQVLSTLTATDGRYALNLPVGNYTLTASAFGYLSASIPAVEIISGTQTVRNFALDIAPTRSVSGFVQDANTGWPVYARITIQNTPLGSIWTDPQTGYYRVSLPVGQAYSFAVQAFLPGYLPRNITVGPVSNDLSQNIALWVDVEACEAPGYAISAGQATLYDFESGPQGFRYAGATSWAWGVPNSGPRRAYSGYKLWATNLSGNYANNEAGYLRFPTLDMSAYPGKHVVLEWQQWLKSEAGYDLASLEVSKDGGVNWETVYGPVSGDVALQWQPQKVVLDTSYAVAGFRARFHFISDEAVAYPGWYVDDVRVSIGRCAAQVGGLVVGSVLDANTLQGLVGARAADEKGVVFITQATPLDPALPDGFYALFSPAGAHNFSASNAGGYQTVTATVSVTLNAAIRYDFHLPVGSLLVTPSALSVTLPLGSSAVQQLTIRNQGSAAANYNWVELDKGVVPMEEQAPPVFVVKPFRQQMSDTRLIKLPAAPAAPLVDGGNVLRAWPATSQIGPWGIAYDGAMDTVWVSSPASGWAGNDRMVEYTMDGAPTGRSYLHAGPAHFFGPADLAFNWNTGKVWVLSVDLFSPSCIYEVDPAAGYTGNYVCPVSNGYYYASQRGLAYDPATDTWFTGGWNDLRIYRFDANGEILETIHAGLPVAGLAYNPTTQHLFVMLNTDPNDVYVLDTAHEYALVGRFSVGQGFSGYAGAGLEIDCEGNLWAVDQNSDLVYQFESGELGNPCRRETPWLSESPVSGVLAAQNTQVVNVTFDAGALEVDQPGVYSARLRLFHDTPYPVAAIPVTMTVLAPPAWGSLSGVVSSLGYCDQENQLLEAAQVQIQDHTGNSWLVQTDAQGHYQRWLNSSDSPYTLVVTATDHTRSQAVINMMAGGSVEKNFALHWLRPCISAPVEPISATVKRGEILPVTRILSNTGYADSGYGAWDVERAAGLRILQPAALGPVDSRAPNGPVGFSAPVYVPSDPNNLLLNEDFESGVMPPAAWSVKQTSFSTWDVDTYGPHTGSYYAHVIYYYYQDEWLVSPEMTLVDGLLSFWSFGSVYWCRDTYDNCDLNVWLLVGDPDTPNDGDDIFLGAVDRDWPASWIWAQSVFDLRPYLPGGPVRIAFQYVGSDGAEVGIDDMMLDGIHVTDAPWLRTRPDSGVVTLQGAEALDVLLDAETLAISQPGAYYADWYLHTDDPVQSWLHVPVTMTVLEAQFGVQVSPEAEAAQDVLGATVTYTLQVTNTSEVQETFNLALQTQGNHSWTASVAPSVGPVPPGASVSVPVLVQIPLSASVGSSAVVTATVTAKHDVSQQDRVRLTTTALLPDADLELGKSAVPQAALYMNVVTYTLTITNHGPTKAALLQVVDTLPAGMTYLGSDAPCLPDGNRVVCTLTIPAGQSLAIHLWVRPRVTGILVNQAVIQYAYDANLTNNQSSVAISAAVLIRFALLYKP